jgi:hypothetical protein
MANIILRSLSVGLSTGATTKNAPLTNTEVDANFNNLNREKLERNGSVPMTGTLALTDSQVAALRLVGISDPAAPQDGDLWLDGTTGMLKIRANDTTYTLFSSYNLVGTANQVIMTTVGGVTTLSTPQDLAPTSRTRFASLGVGVAPSTVDGRIDAANDVVAFSTSDARLKQDIRPIGSALEKVRDLNGVLFTWDTDTVDVHGYEGQSVGVLAQDVQRVLPEAVRERDNGYLAVDYEKLVPLLIEAIKDLTDEIEQLRMLSVL